MTRLPMETIEDLHRQLAGDPVTEERVLRYIRHHWNARSLAWLPERVAKAVLERPGKFLAACKVHAEEGGLMFV